MKHAEYIITNSGKQNALQRKNTKYETYWIFSLKVIV